MPFDPTKERRIVVVDVLDVSTGKPNTDPRLGPIGTAIEVLVPVADVPRDWGAHPTAAQVLDFLATEPEVRAAGADKSIVTKERAGLDASKRLIEVVKEMKAAPALDTWRAKRRVADAKDEVREVLPVPLPSADEP